MSTLTVEVSNQKPVSGARIFVTVHHNIMPDTWLEDRTDSSSQAKFSIDGYVVVDISVNGRTQKNGISLEPGSKAA
ncbi:MAG: hypothetical protein ACKVRN_04110 [Pyrinomonadaceae bacterium]